MTISWSNITKLLNYSTMFQQGLIVTVLLALCTVFFGFFLAFGLALMLLSDVRPLRYLEKIKTDDMERKKRLDFIARFNPVKFIASAYVQFVRCTPMLVQIFLVYYIVFGYISLPKFTFLGFIQFERFFPAAVALALNSGGYMSAVIRGGIEGVDGGQTEAARSLGMSKGQTMYHIILPQAVKNILPAVANEFVTIIKESSVCYTIGVQDIMFNVKSVQSATFIIAEPLLMATFLYFCLCYPTSKIIEHVERRMRQSDNR
ncbi:amino acid ABC transporter permease [Oribacterium sp. FC2011]|uniref:amino acid ABC transporter permease n=1 Tax=Oribacterium sp. FC2011 TaxID=1408311 RepID=UPI0006795462|nr:amino acid ABC transporter permease [Oribacterium sp. FC2011]